MDVGVEPEAQSGTADGCGHTAAGWAAAGPQRSVLTTPQGLPTSLPSSFGFRSPLICALVGHTVGKANTQRAQGF